MRATAAAFNLNPDPIRAALRRTKQKTEAAPIELAKDAT
jgi:hypothetical protein